MKKVISVAMASAMVLGMGANAFAVEYNTGANDTAAWPSSFRFEEPLFVIDKKDNVVTDSRTDLNDSQNFDFMVGDKIYMPLSAADQIVYGVEGASPNLPSVAKRTVSLGTTTNTNIVDGKVSIYEGNADSTGNTVIVAGNFTYLDTANKILYYYGYNNQDDAAANSAKPEKGWVNWRGVAIPEVNLSFYTSTNKSTKYWKDISTADLNAIDTITMTATTNTVVSASNEYAYGTTVYSCNWNGLNKHTAGPISADDVSKYSKYLDDAAERAQSATVVPTQFTTSNIARLESGINTITTNATIKVILPAVASQSGSDGKFVITNDESVNHTQDLNQVVKDGIYTGNIDKNWSINLVEDTHSAGKITDIVKSAEFYRATTADVASYSEYFVPKGVYIKVTLKDYFDSVDTADLKYYAYISRNNGTVDQKTNQVWVAGTYANNGTKDVDFKWTNPANEAAVWKVKKGENGTAVFDFKDKAFFTVKMYSEEKMYLDLDTVYQKAVANEWDAEFDSFYKFKGTNANFAREGELILQSDDANLNVYQLTVDGDLVPVEAAYVEDYQLTHTSDKISGYVFNTKELGNYVLSVDELEASDEEVVEDEPVDDVVPDEVVKEPTETPATPENPVKNNPSTGADDFVGVAVALAVVSVAAAGALALKK